MAIIFFTAVLTMSVLYAPQPLLPAIAAEFDVSRETAALLTTISFFPLCLAPLVYGYLLESWPARRMLRGAVLLLAVSEIVFFLAPSFGLLLGIRLVQGLLVPAVLTAMMTYIANVSRRGAVQGAMAGYVAATIFGGFLGRALSGLFASWLGWRSGFLILAGSLVVLCFVQVRLAPEEPLGLQRPSPRMLVQVATRRGCRSAYLMIFCLFLVFAAVMNYLPFRLTEISAEASEFRIGMMYTGYLFGIATALNAVRLGGMLGGAHRAMGAGLAVFTLALIGLGAANIPLLFLVMFVFCGAMFLVHATASGFLNRLVPENRGVVNGLYVAFYYAGGVVGSYLPGFVYRRFGWTGFLGTLLLVALAGLAAWTGLRPPVGAVESGRDT